MYLDQEKRLSVPCQPHCEYKPFEYDVAIEKREKMDNWKDFFVVKSKKCEKGEAVDEPVTQVCQQPNFAEFLPRRVSR